MTTVLRRRPWKQQPQEAVGLDPRWGLTPEICWLGAIPSMMRPGELGAVTGMLPDVSRAGRVVSGVGTAGHGVTIGGGSTAARTAATFVAVCRRSGTGGAYHGLISLTGQSGSNQGVYLSDDGSGSALAVVRGGVTAMATVFVPADTWLVVVASWRQVDGSNYLAYAPLDGGATVVQLDTHPGAMIGGDGTYCVGRVRGDVPSWPGDIAAAVASFDWLDLALARDILRNPWSLFGPHYIRVPIASAGGGVPNITFVGAESILATSAGYRVSLNYA